MQFSSDLPYFFFLLKLLPLISYCFSIPRVSSTLNQLRSQPAGSVVREDGTAGGVRPLVATVLAQLAAAQLQRGPVVVDDLAVLEGLVQRVVAGALLAGVIAAHLAEVLQLLVGHLDRFLEQDPGDRLGAGWGGQGAQIGPVGFGGRQQVGRIEGLRHGDLERGV